MAMDSSTGQPPWTPPEPMLAPVAGGAEALTHAIDRFSGRWQKLRDIAPDTLGELRQVATVESVASSTRIEGVTLSDSEVAAVLAGLTVDSFRARDEQEVRGYGELLETIFADHARMELTESTVKALHQILLRHSEKDAWHRGDYKKGPNHVEATQPDWSTTVVFRTAPPSETRWWMPRLLAELRAAWDSGDWHPAVLTADFVLWFLAIHPFQDGNGRMSRALTTLLLLKAGYEYVPYSSLERVVEDNKAAYNAALRASQTTVVSDGERYRDWLTFFLTSMRTQQQTLESTLEHALARAGLVPPQQRILDAIRMRGPQSSGRLAEDLGLNPRTVRYHLARLVAAGKLDTSPRRAGRLYALPSRP